MAIFEYSALLILVSCLVGGSSLTIISTSIQEQSDREFTTNDLNPMMELTNGYHQAFKAFNQGDKNATIESDYSKNKNIPEYMFDIYTHKIERMVFGNPFDNVRIYKSSFTGFKDSFLENIYQRSNSSSVHHLIFNNVSDFSANEELQAAQLKLWAFVHRAPGNNLGVRRLFRIYLTNGYAFNPWDLEILDFQFVIESRNTWLTFNVTHAVKWWTDHKVRVKMIQVRIDPVHPSEIQFGSIEINLRNEGGLEPQLVVYSTTKDQEEKTGQTNARREKRSVAKTQRKTKSQVNCRRRPLYVNFTKIKYDEWIIAPEGFEAYECAGRCDFPLSDHLTPPRHSIIQSLVHSIHPDRVGKVCCVPVRLDPISLLYFDEQGVLTYKYRYEEMAVAECGCR